MEPLQTKTSRRRGQTLIEALIALSVITMGFLGIMALLSKSFFYNRTITDQLTASYLASEGIEIAKNLIDHDVFSGAAWGSCFTANTSAMNGNNVGDFALDDASIDCLRGYSSGMFLQFDPATNAYRYGITAGSSATGFSRDVRVALTGANEITVTSIVRWDTGPVTGRSVVLEDHFYKWR
jgi:type II secretory pathway pseudopilin PulG